MASPERLGVRRLQRGAALLVLLVVLVLGASWFLVSRLDAIAGAFTAIDRNHNAVALNQAKQTLIGYVAKAAAEGNESNPGRFPCPEAAGNVGNPASEGTAAPNCTLPAVGRLPWRTLGIDKLRDSANEPLWYVVSAGWALSNSTSPPLTTYINSDCGSAGGTQACTTGQLTVDGSAKAAVAVIIARVTYLLRGVREAFLTVPLEVVQTQTGEFTAATLSYIDEVQARWENDIVNVLIPEFFVQHWWGHLLHNQSTLILKGRLLFRKSTAVTSIPASRLNNSKPRCPVEPLPGWL